MSELAIAAENAARVAGTIDFEKASLAFALGDTAVRWHDRLSANSALVSETLASMIARDSVALHSTVNLVADAFVPTTSTLESLGAELARALKPSRAVVCFVIGLGGKLDCAHDSAENVMDAAGPL